jgi:hypothetical protein
MGIIPRKHKTIRRMERGEYPVILRISVAAAASSA